MNQDQVLAELEKLGTTRIRTTYERHGVTGPMFGVSYANLGALSKKIRVDQAMAEKLWESGNHDARVLATMVADPGQMSMAKLDRWLKDVDNYVLNDAFSALAARSRAADRCMRKWIAARGEYAAAAGWTLVGRLAEEKGDCGYPNEDAEGFLDAIEAEIHGSQNRVKHAMNQALICLGLRSAKMKRKAIAAAKRIGRVEVDHGQTGCKTPEAVAYIEKADAHRKLMKARQKKKARAR